MNTIIEPGNAGAGDSLHAPGFQDNQQRDIKKKPATGGTAAGSVFEVKGSHSMLNDSTRAGIGKADVSANDCPENYAEAWSSYFETCEKKDLMAAFDALVKLGMRPVPVGADDNGKIKKPIGGTGWGLKPNSAQRTILETHIADGEPIGLGVQPDGYLVIDLDCKDKDRSRIGKFWESAGKLLFGEGGWPETFAVSTEGGAHVWLRLTGELASVMKETGKFKHYMPDGDWLEFFSGTLDKQIQVACPPSVGKTISAKFYPVPVPASLAEFLLNNIKKKAIKPPTQKHLSKPIVSKPIGCDKQVELDRLNAYVKPILSDIANAPNGTKHDILFKKTAKISNLFAGTGVESESSQYKEQILNSLAANPGTVASWEGAIKTIDDGWAKGAETPDYRLANKSDNLTSKPRVDEAISLFLESVILRYHAGEFFRYDSENGVYRRVDEKELRGVVSAFLRKYLLERPIIDDSGMVTYRDFSASMAGSVWAGVSGTLITESKNDQKQINPPGILNVQNGLLNWTTGELRPHTEDVFTTRQCSWEWTPNAGKPIEFLEFLGSVLGVCGEDNPDLAKEIRMIQEYFGYVLSGSNDHHKILTVIGPERSGKGTILNTLELLIGSDNFFSTGKSQSGRAFSLQEAIGRRLIAFPDVRTGWDSPSQASDLSEMLLSVSANDPMTVERKFLTSWRGRLNACVTIMSNSMPKLLDESPALANRLLVIETKQSFLNKEDPYLFRKLEKSIEKIALWAWQGWVSLQERGRFERIAAQDEAISNLADIGNPLRVFVRECLVMGDAETKVSCEEVRSAYLGWSEKNGHKPISSTKFGMQIRPVLLPMIGRKFKREVSWYNGKSVKCYFGFTLDYQD